MVSVETFVICKDTLAVFSALLAAFLQHFTSTNSRVGIPDRLCWMVGFGLLDLSLEAVRAAGFDWSP